MGLFSRKNKNEKESSNGAISPVSAAPQPPMGAPKPPMAPGMMPPPIGAPKPPMAPGMTPPPAMGAPKPPMAPGMMPPPMGAPKPPMAPGMMPPPIGAPKPPMAPGMTPPPPMGMMQSMGPGPAIPPAPTFGSSFGNNSFNSNTFNSSLSFLTPSTSNGELEAILLTKKEYFPVRSIISNSKVTYDQFCSELTFEYFNSLLHSPNLLDQKPLVAKIKKALLFVLTSTKDLPENQRTLVFNASVRFVDFLKAVVYYPDQQKVDDEVVAYLPFLKEVAQSFSRFLVRNR